MVLASVSGDLGDVAVGQTLDIDIVAGDIGHALAVGRQGGNLHGLVACHSTHLAGLAVIDKKPCGERMAIDGFAVGPEQDGTLAVAHLIAVPAAHLCRLHGQRVEHSGLAPPGLVGIASDGLAPVGDLVITLAVTCRGDGSDAHGACTAQHIVLQCECASTHAHRHGGKQYHGFVHSSL